MAGETESQARRRPEYSGAQLKVSGRYALAFLGTKWFGSSVPSGAEYFLLPLIIGVYLAYREGELPSKTEAKAFLPTRHPTTAQSYLQLAERLDLLKVARASKQYGDRRKYWVYPTTSAIRLVEQHLASIADNMRYALADLLLFGQLPKREGVPSFKRESKWDYKRSPYSYLELPKEEKLPAGPKSGREMMRRLNETIRVTPRNAAAYMTRGHLYAMNREHDKAISDFRAAVQLDPEVRFFSWQVTELFRELGRYDDALEEFTEAIRIRPSAETYFNRAQFLLEDLKDVPKALADLDQAVALDDEYARAYELHGDIYYERGRWAQALAEYRRAQMLGDRSESTRARIIEIEGRLNSASRKKKEPKRR